MIMTSCLKWGTALILLNHRLVQFDNCIVVREYFGRCICGAVVTDEDFLEEDQVYLEIPEPNRHFPRSRKFDK